VALLHCAKFLDRGRTRSRETWRSYAEALYDWLQTCETNGWAWDAIDEGHLRAYRNQMLYHPSSLTGRAYSPRTVNSRLRRLAMFYSWAFRRRLITQRVRHGSYVDQPRC
jgi:site-specific recombinase XerD